MSGRNWSHDEDRVLVWAHRRGIPLTHICAPLERSYFAVRCRAHRLGLWWRDRRGEAAA